MQAEELHKTKDNELKKIQSEKKKLLAHKHKVQMAVASCKKNLLVSHKGDPSDLPNRQTGRQAHRQDRTDTQTDSDTHTHTHTHTLTEVPLTCRSPPPCPFSALSYVLDPTLNFTRLSMPPQTATKTKEPMEKEPKLRKELTKHLANIEIKAR